MSVLVDPRGATPGGLPYPEDSDPVVAGAQAIRALAEAAENKLIGGSPQSVYEALRNLGTTPAPIAWTYPPEFGVGSLQYTPANNMLQMVAVTVPHAYSCVGVGMVTHAVGSGYPGSVYNGCGLWQYAANGDATFLRDTGASNGAMWTVLGLNLRPWVTPITLTPGVVYLVGFTQQSSVPNMAAIRGLGGSQANATIPTNALFQRSVAVAAPGSTQAAVMKTWPAASLVPQANLPLMVLYG
jgi:hypothetical protein